MAATAKKGFALDLNLPLDLAAKEPYARSLVKFLRDHSYSLWLPPTAVTELALIAKTFEHPSNSLAITAARCLTTWGIAPYDLISVGHGITEQFARALIRRGLLPEDEFNDGVILAEASLMGVTSLISSDEHLTKIDEDELALVFQERDLSPVSVIRPRRLVDLLNRRRA
jgi:hypothetical protein